MKISTVEEIKSAISELSPEQFARIREWVTSDDLPGSKPLAKDHTASRLKHLIQEIEGDIASGRVRPLNRVLQRS